MQKKVKQYLLSFSVQAAVAAGLFAVVFIIGKISPSFLKMLQPVWTKSTDIQKIGTLFKELFREVLP